MGQYKYSVPLLQLLLHYVLDKLISKKLPQEISGFVKAKKTITRLMLKA